MPNSAETNMPKHWRSSCSFMSSRRHTDVSLRPGHEFQCPSFSSSQCTSHYKYRIATQCIVLGTVTHKFHQQLRHEHSRTLHWQRLLRYVTTTCLSQISPTDQICQLVVTASRALQLHAIASTTGRRACCFYFLSEEICTYFDSSTLWLIIWECDIPFDPWSPILSTISWPNCTFLTHSCWGTETSSSVFPVCSGANFNSNLEDGVGIMMQKKRTQFRVDWKTWTSRTQLICYVSRLFHRSNSPAWPNVNCKFFDIIQSWNLHSFLKHYRMKGSEVPYLNNPQSGRQKLVMK